MRGSLAILLMIASSASAAPSVFVQSAPGLAFWNSDKNLGRVLEKQAGPITSKALTKFISDNRLYGPYEVCALSAATRESYVQSGGGGDGAVR